MYDDCFLPFFGKGYIISIEFEGRAGMKFFSDIRLLLLGIWLGAACFFIAVAQGAFAVFQQQPEYAGAIVNRTLMFLNYGGMGIAAFLLLTSLVGVANISRLSIWAERVLLLIIAAACAVGQFVIGLWLSMIRSQMDKPIGELAEDDPLRVSFNAVHEYSVWVLFAAMAAALIAFFIIANRKFGVAKAAKSDVYDFSKEFKI